MLIQPAEPMRTTRRPSPDAAVLDQLRDENVNLVSWRRALPSSLDDQLVAWARHFPAEFDETVSMPRYDLSGATRGLAEPARTWLITDVAVLLAQLAHLANADRLRVSLGAVRSDQCRKFHVDHVRYRLVTTYTGPGTEWVPDDAVRREALGHPVDCPCDANRDILRDAGAVRHAAVGEVIVMKGARHEHEHGRGAVHRSPPIEGTGRVRVVLIASSVGGP